MGRILILLLIVAIAALWVYNRVAQRRARDAQPPTRPAARPDPTVQDMVACAHCGVHLPRGDAVAEGSLHFCGDAHRRLGRRA